MRLLVRRSHFCFLLSALCFFSACTPLQPRPEALPPPPAQLTATGHAQRVVLVSFDGLSADAVKRFGVPAIENMNARVERVVPVNPTSTSSAHAAILTGLPPERTGVVSQQFHKPGTPIDEIARGLETEIDAPTIVENARAAGKRVGCIEFPFLDSRSPRRTCDFGLLWPAAVARSNILHFAQKDFHAEWLPPTWGVPAPPHHPSFSPVLRVRFEWGAADRAREDADLAAYDTTDDGVRNYDAFSVETREGEHAVDAKGWFPLSAHANGATLGAWAKILRRDAGLETLTLYVGPVALTQTYPASFHDLVEREAGFAPAPPDEARVRDWINGGDGIDAQTFTEEVERFSEFMTKTTVLAVQRMQFDLLLSYQSIGDQAQHQFAIERPSQFKATPELIEAATGVLRATYAAIDRASAAMTAAIDPSRDAILITGDHGYAAYDVDVRLNAMLPPNWRAYSNGFVTNLYKFNDAAGDDTIVKSLVELRAPDGAVVFERVTKRTPDMHPNFGDIIAYSYPRFAMWNTPGPLFSQSANYGQHGGLRSHAEFDTTLGATGAGIPPVRIETMPQTEIAPVVRELLGLGK